MPTTDPKTWPYSQGEMARRIGEFDWSKTSLGPASSWPPELRSFVDVMLSSPAPSSMVCGSELIFLYNDAASSFLGDRHPGALGRPMQHVFPEHWAEFGPQILEAFLQKEGTRLKNFCKLLWPANREDEAYFSYSLLPVRASDDGRMIALFNVFEDAAEAFLAQAAQGKREQRQAFLLKLSDSLRAEQEPAAIAKRALSLLRDELAADLCVVGRCLADEQVCHHDYQVGSDSLPCLPETLSLAEMPGVRRALSHRIIAVGSVEQSSRLSQTEKGRLEHLGICSALVAAPRIGDERSGWGIAVLGASSRVWSPSDQELVEEVAERMWAAIETAQTQHALHKSEQRFRELMEGIPQLVWRAVEEGKRTWSSPQWEAFTGQPSVESKGWGWLDAVHPEDRTLARDAWNAASDRGLLEAEYRLRQQPGGTYRWFQTRATPIHNAGTIVEWLGTSTDVQHIKELHEHQRLLLSELQHRVRNILAMTRSLMRQSMNAANDIEDYVSHLIGRVDAMARTQLLLTRSATAQVELEDLVYEELLACGGSEDLLEISGRSVALSPKAAEVLTQVFHELTANSIKFGVLGQNEGEITVRWQLEPRKEDRWLRLEWREKSLGLREGPAQAGFGTEMIEQRVPYELRGEGRLLIDDKEVTALISFPLVEGSSILETGLRQESGHG